MSYWHVPIRDSQLPIPYQQRPIRDWQRPMQHRFEPTWRHDIVNTSSMVRFRGGPRLS